MKIVMDYKRRTILFGCLLTFVKIWNVISCTGITFTKYHYDPSLAGYRCIPSETAFEVDDVFDPLQCGKLCHLGNICRSVFYKPESNKCIGCRVNPGVPNCDIETSSGSNYFRTKPFYRDKVPASVTDCKDIFENDCSSPSGLYNVTLWKSKKILTVFCDMETAGGGWTVFQNRFDGSVDFFRNSSEYENGFGDKSGEFWLGLKFVQEMASHGKTELRLDLTAGDGRTGYETFPNFKLDNSPNYTLHLDPGTTNIKRGVNVSFSGHDGYHFSTYDADRDVMSDYHCAEVHTTGWWFDDTCQRVNLNGVYSTPGEARIEGAAGAIIHVAFDGLKSLKSARMMFRRM
ncbi:microfibril-associated glycoprotein 4-like [Mercenaria mercenaria]|uniref:microfibril-associated glycoprotein 4-like n=1 Tax=Mercenaria mercenaria TaxID=6596 RepID=UPI00234F6832|nr:microfibril-associated glycoprotein 4-like [Mercenaria mercenaria]